MVEVKKFDSTRIQHGFNTPSFSAKKKNRENVMFTRFFRGGDEGDRTPYLLNAIQALSQVSYTPTASIILAY